MNLKKIAIVVIAAGFGLIGSRAQVVQAPQVVPAITPLPAQIPFGPVLDVIPYVSADGYSIQMSIVPTLTEFLGYDTDVSQTFQTIVGNQQLQPTPLPRFRVRQVVTSAIVWDGQTIVLGGLIAENVRKTKDKIPLLGDIPFVGRLFRSERSTSEKRNLVVFVTPKLIDPAGNRVHASDNLPYDPNVVPLQPAGSTARPLRADPIIFREAAKSVMNMSEGTNAPRLLIVDGHAYAYRAFYAIRQLNSPEGLGTNAIYGFIKMLAKMQVRVKPTHVAVVWDGGLDAKRMALHPEYKAQRPASPADLDRQISEIQQYLEHAGLPSCQEDGVEADDVICVLCQEALREGYEAVIASSDKDFMQLVSARVGILNPNDKSETIWGPAEVKQKTGVEPSQVLDWLSLIGDSVDNIPGVPGVGPTTAANLLNQFGSIDAIYARLDEVKSDRLRNLLRESEPVVRKNLDLIRLNDCVDGGLNLKGCLLKAADEPRLIELYRRWGFKSMLQELEARQEAQPCLL